MASSADNLFDPGLWRPALEKYAAVTRLMVHVYDTDGHPEVPWAAANPLASLFEERAFDPGLFEECTWRCLNAGARREPVLVEGAYGLAVVGTPLVLDGTVVGAAVAGYVLVDFTQVYAMHRLADESGVSFERLWHTARLLAPVPRDRLMLHGQLLQALGDALLRENLRTRTSQQNEAELQLESAAKDEFLAVLSHELRNPLASLSSALEVIEMTPDVAMAAKSRAIMRRQVGRLARLVDDLMQVSRVTQGKLHLQSSRIALGGIVESAVEDALDYIEEAGHELLVNVPEEPIFVDADPLRMAQVLGNLLSNAAKYTPDGGRIELSAERHGDGVRLIVRDNGVGIPADKLDSLFHMYTQLDQSVVRGHRGLGIGLSLARSLVEMQGGRIDVQSDGADKGSAFTVWLPLAADAEAETTTSHAAGDGSSVDQSSAASAATPSRRKGPRRAVDRGVAPRRVLVVEDNVDAADSMAALIEMMGHETRVARDGPEGLQAAAKFRPQLVLLDIGLPKLDGYDVARRIRAKAWGKHMVLAAVTGWGQDSDRDRAREAGFDRHLTKPVTLEALRELLLEMAALRDAESRRASQNRAARL